MFWKSRLCKSLFLTLSPTLLPLNSSFLHPSLLLFSHASFSSFPSTTFCPHWGSFLHQSQFTLLPPVSPLNLSVLPPYHCSPFTLAFSYLDLDPSSLIPACVHFEPVTSLPNQNQTSLPTTRKLQKFRVVVLLPSTYHWCPCSWIKWLSPPLLTKGQE